MPTLTFDFPDDETRSRFVRWWALHGQASCFQFIEASLDRQDEPYLYVTHNGSDPDTWRFYWDPIPF